MGYRKRSIALLHRLQICTKLFITSYQFRIFADKFFQAVDLSTYESFYVFPFLVVDVTIIV